MTTPAGLDRAPSASLPLSYLATAATAFAVAALGTAWLAPEIAGHYYHPRLLALTHTVTLGWITLSIFGASYQLVPIVLERRLWSERLARWQFGALVVGLVGMVAHFLIGGWPGLAWAAALVAAAAVMHLLNIALTIRGSARWTFTARLVTAAHVGLALTIVSGLLLGIDHAVKILPGAALENLHAHAHLALLGWVAPMVFGVAARVYPLFLLAPAPHGWPGPVQLSGVAFGVPAVAVGLAARLAPLVTLGALAVTAAVFGHLTWMIEVARKRRRPRLDWPLRFALTGTVFLVPATALGVLLALDVVAGPRAAIAYAALALGGWASLTIVGMMLKIVPFLVWYRVYAPRVGRAPVPMLADLAAPRLEATAYVLLTIGVSALVVAAAIGDADAIRVAGFAVAGGALAFIAALSRALAHLVPRRRPREMPVRLVHERSS